MIHIILILALFNIRSCFSQSNTNDYDSTNDLIYYAKDLKCGDIGDKHRLFDLRGSEATLDNCKEKCKNAPLCKAFSMQSNIWCIGCDICPSFKHTGAQAYRRSKTKSGSECTSDLPDAAPTTDSSCYLNKYDTPKCLCPVKSFPYGDGSACKSSTTDTICVLYGNAHKKDWKQCICRENQICLPAKSSNPGNTACTADDMTWTKIMTDHYCSNRLGSGGENTESIQKNTLKECAEAVSSNVKCGLEFNYGTGDKWCDCVAPATKCIGVTSDVSVYWGYNVFKIQNPSCTTVKCSKAINECTTKVDASGMTDPCVSGGSCSADHKTKMCTYYQSVMACYPSCYCDDENFKAMVKVLEAELKKTGIESCSFTCGKVPEEESSVFGDFVWIPIILLVICCIRIAIIAKQRRSNQTVNNNGTGAVNNDGSHPRVISIGTGAGNATIRQHQLPTPIALQPMQPIGQPMQLAVQPMQPIGQPMQPQQQYLTKAQHGAAIRVVQPNMIVQPVYNQQSQIPGSVQPIIVQPTLSYNQPSQSAIPIAQVMPIPIYNGE